MLRILILSLFTFILTSKVVFADTFDKRVDFFKDKTMQDNGCSECSKFTQELNPILKDKINNMQNQVKGSFIQSQAQNKIILFVDLECGYSDGAIDNLIKFKKDNPSWKVEGVVETGLKNLKQKLLMKQSYFGKDVEFSVDLSMNLAKRCGITKTPTYLLSYQGKYYKIAGQPDLKEIILKLNQ